MSKIEKVTQKTFKSTVIENDKPVLVDFWADWCQPCLRMNPALEELAAETAGDAVVAKVNVDNERALGAMFQIMSIPALLIFKDGKKVREFTGLQSKDTLKDALAEYM